MSILAMERVKGLEPSISAWKANVLPLHYTRVFGCMGESSGFAERNCGRIAAKENSISKKPKVFYDVVRAKRLELTHP